VAHFADGKATLEVGDDVTSGDLAEAIGRIKGLTDAAADICKHNDLDPVDPANLASAAEFVLETLYVSNRLTKYGYHGRTFYKR
jgi:hypothetical protein